MNKERLARYIHEQHKYESWPTSWATKDFDECEEAAEWFTAFFNNFHIWEENNYNE